ncbi:MAG: DUF1028 domain-containing protein [Thermoplasmata archaeon]
MAPAVSRLGTFSIVAHDPERGEWGIAVQSKFIAVGAVVPWAEANVGAVATQAFANVRYGPDGLELFRKGLSADEVVRQLTARDAKRESRQVGVVDSQGRAAAFTGKECLDWAGHFVGKNFTCQGNILYAKEVVQGMARSFESTPGDLPERLLAALAAGQREGGDRRGMQSAAMLIVRKDSGYDEGNDRWVDLRVDEHVSPIEELKRMFKIYDLVMLTREDPDTLVRIDGDVARTLQQQLTVLGYYAGRVTATWDALTQAAFTKFLSEHNFENKARSDATVWPSILDYLRERSQAEVARRTTTQPIVTGALDRGPGAAKGGAPSPSSSRDKATGHK